MTCCSEYIYIVLTGVMMVGSEEKLWLLLDGVLKKLLHGKYWSTSADDWDSDIKEAIEHIGEAMKKIEKKIKKKT